MLGWLLRGLRTGVVTTAYPRKEDPQFLRTVPRVDLSYLYPGDCLLLADTCPTSAMTCEEDDGALSFLLDYGSCISCGLCAEALPGAISMSSELELAARDREDLGTTYTFGRDGNGR